MRPVEIFLFFVFLGMSFACLPVWGNENLDYESINEYQDYELNKKDECICRLGSKNRIVGGEVAEPNSIP